MDSPVVVEQGVGNDEADVAAATLWAAGATAVQYREEELTTTLIASFPTATAAHAVAAEVGGRAVEITDSSWQDAWRAHAVPVVVSSRLVIVPAWKPLPLPGSQLVLQIDPGSCFGSGSHPSTRLALHLLASESMWGKRVLDVGTGSGILAVAAARLGAAGVTAIDVDPEAVSITSANAARNNVGPVIDASTTPVEALTGTYDVAVVNVTAGVHAALAASVVARVRGGGRVLVAGLLPGQWRHVEDSYPGCVVVEQPDLDGWSGAVLLRPV